MKIYRLTLAVFLLVTAHYASAHSPLIIAPPSQHDVIQVDPGNSQALYGELAGFPHMYEITSEEPFVLHAEILVPDIEGQKNKITGMVLRKEARGVKELARLKATDASWESWREPFGGDRYRVGGRYETEVEAGTYLIEVSTPENIGKYVLVLGGDEKWEGYVATLRGIANVKEFFGKPRIALVESPLVYIPLVVLIVALAGAYFYMRQKRKRKMMI